MSDSLKPGIRCLWVSREMPYPLVAGDRVYSAGMAKALAEAGVHVTYFAHQGPGREAGEEPSIRWDGIPGGTRSPLLVAAFSMIGFGSLTLIPVFAKDILQIGVTGFGQLLSWQGIGALIGGVLLILFGDSFHKGRLLLISRLIMGPGIISLAFSRIPWISMLMMALLGFSFLTQLVITNTMIQIIVPDELRGRVLSTYTWALGGFYPLGSLMMGALGDQIGAPTTALISGAGCIFIIMLNLILYPGIHDLN